MNQNQVLKKRRKMAQSGIMPHWEPHRNLYDGFRTVNISKKKKSQVASSFQLRLDVFHTFDQGVCDKRHILICGDK